MRSITKSKIWSTHTRRPISVTHLIANIKHQTYNTQHTRKNSIIFNWKIGDIDDR
jgi:hypothetical protein